MSWATCRLPRPYKPVALAYRAILSFDPQRGMAFSTQAWTCIVCQVWQGIKVAQRSYWRRVEYLPLDEVAL